MRINSDRISDMVFFFMKVLAGNAVTVTACGMIGFGIFKIPAEVTENSRMANNFKLATGIFFVASILGAIPMVFLSHCLKSHERDLDETYKKMIFMYIMINAILVTAASAMIDPEGAKEKNFWRTAHFAVGSLLMLALLYYPYQKCMSSDMTPRRYDEEPVDIVVGVPAEVPPASPVDGVVMGAAPGAVTLRDILAPEDEPAFPRAPF